MAPDGQRLGGWSQSSAVARGMNSWAFEELSGFAPARFLSSPRQVWQYATSKRMRNRSRVRKQRRCQVSNQPCLQNSGSSLASDSGYFSPFLISGIVSTETTLTSSRLYSSSAFHLSPSYIIQNPCWRFLLSRSSANDSSLGYHCPAVHQHHLPPTWVSQPRKKAVSAAAAIDTGATALFS